MKHHFCSTTTPNLAYSVPCYRMLPIGGSSGIFGKQDEPKSGFVVSRDIENAEADRETIENMMENSKFRAIVLLCEFHKSEREPNNNFIGSRVSASFFCVNSKCSLRTYVSVFHHLCWPSVCWCACNFDSVPDYTETSQYACVYRLATATVARSVNFMQFSTVTAIQYTHWPTERAF